MNTPLNAKIFERSFVYMSRDLKNVDRDWQKVTGVSLLVLNFIMCLELTIPCLSVVLQAPRRIGRRLHSQLHQVSSER